MSEGGGALSKVTQQAKGRAGPRSPDFSLRAGPGRAGIWDTLLLPSFAFFSPAAKGTELPGVLAGAHPGDPVLMS